MSHNTVSRCVDPLDLLGRIVAALPDGEDRPQQRDMVAAVDAALRSGEHLAVQGPTGVGKSIAYLLPVIAAAERGARTVVVTSSRALQDQLGRVDLPFLSELLGGGFTFEVLKGRNNYVCQAAVAETVVRLGNAPDELDLGDATASLRAGPLADELEELVGWATTSATGERAELEVEPSDEAWAAISVGAGECPGASRCDHAADCFSEQARERAGVADVVVVNAHLYAAHLQAGRMLLGDHDVLVIDEAHEFEDAMVGALGVSVGPGRLRALARTFLRNVAESPGGAGGLEAAADELDASLRDAHSDAHAEHRSGRLRGDLPEELAHALADARIAVDAATNALLDVAKAARESSRATARHQLERAVRSAESLSDDLDSITGTLAAGQVRWISESATGRLQLQLTRIDIADALRATAWEIDPVADGAMTGDATAAVGEASSDTRDAPGADAPTVILCSATLDPGTARRLGLDARFVAIDTPFDFRSNGLLYVPRLPRPSADAWPDAVVEELAHVLELAGGRTLALFTSHRMLRRTVAEVRDRLPDHRILAQGDAPTRALQREFLDDEHASLFATASFWTGISSPGATCSAVVIDKIPFPVPTDPIVEARCEAVGDARAFAEVSVPAAGMQLAQGVGRLIRTATDRGVVAVLDPRLAESGYRKRILDLLPPMRRTRDRSDLDAFIGSLELD